VPIAEYASVFVRPPRERLAAAAHLVGAVPGFLAGAQGELDLHHCSATGYLAILVRAVPEAFTPEAVARLAFWSARAGARTFPVHALPAADRDRFQAELRLCERTVKKTPLAQVPDVASRLFRGLGVGPPAPSPGARPVLAVDLDGPGAQGIGYRPEGRALFIAGVLAPPVGDQLVLSIREKGAPAPLDGWATVVEVRRREDAAPGRPAGFTLRIEGPTALHELLVRRSRSRPGKDGRAAPRYPVAAPVKVTAAAPAPAAAERPRPVRPPPPRARVEYASDQELAADWIENLSHGGAFVRTASPQPEGTEVALELALPDGARLEAKAVVAFANAKGMGVRFVLSEDQDQVLCAAIARISARPRRALIVDDDELSRRMLADALAARGFEVSTAADAESGLHALVDELLTLDLFVTDLVMPGQGGEALIRTIRQAGGESDLAIVAVSGRLDPAAERSLEAAGADAVLDKALGPELVAQAADAALERKRLVSRADAA
jgi:uncharacterized protein (TIGR02266 family)